MFLLAVCDDNAVFLEIIKSKIKQMLNKVHIEGRVDIYEDSQKLYEVVMKDPHLYDLVILDVDMPQMDGLLLGKKIRGINENILIAFLSQIETAVYESFCIGAFRFIRKNKIEEELEECLWAAYRKSEKLKSHYSFKTKEGMIQLTEKEILYFEYSNRHVEVHTLKNVYTTTLGRLKDIEHYIDNHKFIGLHRSCIVNLKKIKEIKQAEVVLDNGESLVMSRYKRASVLEAFTNSIE